MRVFDNGQPFFTEKELIEEAHDICNNQDDNEIIVTADEASAYLQEQGYGTFHETVQYFDDCDITYNLYRKEANELMFEANTLGAAILCPEDDFRKTVLDCIDEDDYVDMEKVAQHFNVPLSVAKTFGRQLNLIQR